MSEYDRYRRWRVRLGPWPRQATAPIPQPNHRLDPISQIDDNDGKTPDQQAPRQRPELAGDLGLVDTAGEQLGRPQPAGFESVTVLLCRTAARDGYMMPILTCSTAQLQLHPRPSGRHPSTVTWLAGRCRRTLVSVSVDPPIPTGQPSLGRYGRRLSAHEQGLQRIAVGQSRSAPRAAL
jgi:hypothetical protein